MQDIPVFVRDATNVYRTKEYIVKQVIDIQYDSKEAGNVLSHDTFYKRTPARDRQYEYLFSGRRRVNGKRLPSTAYTRRYVD